MTKPIWRRNPRSEEEIDALRTKMDILWGPHGFGAGDTCENCGDRWRCFNTFDPYNTDGECLMSK